LPEFYYSLKTFYKGDLGAIIWKNSSDQVLYTLIKGSEILFTKVITIDDNPLSATIKSIHIVNNESLIVVE